MTATRRPARHRAPARLVIRRFRPVRTATVPRSRLAVLPVCAILAAMLTGTTNAAGSALEAPVPAAHGSAPGSPSAGPGAAVQAGWAWPVGPPREVARPFEAPASRYAAGHRGIDLVAGEGDPVRSPADGVVTFVGRVVDRPVLSIQHAGDLVSSFEPVTATVNEGDRVQAGQVVGVVATGAHCTARCVHFGVRRHGQYISPILFLGGLARAVLLPLPRTVS
jgi:murein DD-endopeptidase MepM/ murein hydrolase activator NlpD